MKKLIYPLLFAVSAMIFLFSCDKIEEWTLNPDDTVAKEGNYWTVQSSGYPNTTVTVTDNKKGHAKLSFNYNGQDYDITAKVTEKQIQDYVYSGGDEDKPFTLVDFDAGVGTKWEYKLGTYTITREVVHKSTTDDYMVFGLNDTNAGI